MAVYEFGPDKTYASPQAALEALAAAVGSAEFTETHILRGYTGTYTPPTGDTVLNIHTVEPSLFLSGPHWLKIEGAEGESVKFEGKYCADADQRFMNNVWFSNIEMEVTENDGRALNFAYFNGLIWIFPDGFLYEDCNIHCDEGLTGTYGIYNASYRTFIEQSKIQGFRTCVGIRDETFGHGLITTFMNGSILESPEYGFYIFDDQVEEAIYLVSALGCTIKSKIGVHASGSAWNLGAAISFNSIWDHSVEDGLVVEIPDIGSGSFYFYGDGSLISVYEYFLDDKWGSYTVEDAMTFYRAMLRAHLHSNAVAGEPDYLKLDEDLYPESGSPALQFGVGAPYLSLNGVSGSRGMTDCGAYQPSPIGYCTPDQVIRMTGIQDQEFEEIEGRLNEQLIIWISQASQIIDQYTLKTWDYPWPEGICRACTMMASNIVGLARQRRKLDAISPQDITLKIVRERESEILTSEVKEILDLFTEAKIGDGTEDYSNFGMSTYTHEDDDA